MKILDVSALTKKFKVLGGEFSAVDNIFFSLEEGEILGLLGPNGAGKTTTLQMLLGVLTPTSGEIKYFGNDLKKHREEILEQINFSSTYTNLPWNLTVKENLIFVSYLYDIKNRGKRIEKISEIFKLEPFLKMRMEELSTGQITRVNLAKSFLNFPKVLLLDEPTASLDPDVAKYIRRFLLDERKEFQVSIIITSHNMAEVEEVCDRVIFINKGKIIADDSPFNLARTIETSHVELLIKDGLKRAEEYCVNHNISFRIDGRYIVIDVREKEIPELLRNLMDKGVFYDEISIEKPTLEDYFLETAKEEKANNRSMKSIT